MNTKKPPLESKIVKITITRLRQRGGFWFKVHGSPMQIAGIPDIVGCYRGRFIAFEAKRDATGRPTALQAFMMGKIREAGGIASLIYTPEMAIAILDRIDARQEAKRAQSSVSR